MYLSKQEFKEEFSPVVESFVRGMVDVFYRIYEEQANVNKKTFAQPQERIMNATEVCDYYGFKASTLRRHQQKGLQAILSKKGCNRMFKFSECERYFNQNK